jgi:DnaA family protein
MKQLALPVQLRASSIFASFYPGSNADTVLRLQSLAQDAASLVTWLFGPAAVGKTHLLQAVCANAGSQGQAAGYLALGEATSRPEMLTGCETLAVVCLDDFERIAGNAEWERAVFRLYTELDEYGGRLLIAANAAPSVLQISLRDLASRLAAGTILRMQELADDERENALVLRASHLGLELTSEVAQFILRRVPRDMTTLCSALDRLDRASLATQRALTIPFVKAVLERDAGRN